MFHTFKNDYASILKVSLFATVVGVVSYIILVEVISTTIAKRVNSHSIYSPMKN